MTDSFEPSSAGEARFERAAEAVVSGDLAELRALVAQDPELVRAASPRSHGASLLHYVAANGVEDERQRVPPNAVDIARFLSAAGAPPDATCGFGGGGPNTTPLISLVTSTWPARAGLHAELVDAFVDGGARVEGLADDGAPLDFALAFGYLPPARALVRRGARVRHLIQAAGLGELEAVRADFSAGGLLAPREHGLPAVWAKRRASYVDTAFFTAARLRQHEVADFLLAQGARADAPGDQGFTALHYAAWTGDLDQIDWLLARGASLEALNDYGGTVLDGFCWGVANTRMEGVEPVAVVERLLAAGARIEAVSPFPTGIAELDSVLRAHGR